MEREKRNRLAELLTHFWLKSEEDIKEIYLLVKELEPSPGFYEREIKEMILHDYDQVSRLFLLHELFRTNNEA